MANVTVTEMPSSFVTAHPDYAVRVLNKCTTDEQRTRFIALWTKCVMADTQLALSSIALSKVGEFVSFAARSAEQASDEFSAFVIDNFDAGEASRLPRGEAVDAIVARVDEVA